MSQSSDSAFDRLLAPQRPWPLPLRADCLFYHSMDFADGESVVGHWDLRGRFDQYIGHYPLRGKSVLDAGTASGFLAFSAEASGARVTAYDASHSREYNRIPFLDAPAFRDRRAWADLEEQTFLKPLKNGFWYAWHKLGSQVEAVYAPLHELNYWERRFDAVMAGAFVCHLADPVSTIGALGRLANHAVIIAFEDILDTDDLMMRVCQRLVECNIRLYVVAVVARPLSPAVRQYWFPHRGRSLRGDLQPDRLQQPANVRAAFKGDDHCHADVLTVEAVRHVS